MGKIVHGITTRALRPDIGPGRFFHNPLKRPMTVCGLRLGVRQGHTELRVLAASFDASEVTCRRCLEVLAQETETAMERLPGPIRGRASSMKVLDNEGNWQPLPPTGWF